MKSHKQSKKQAHGKRRTRRMPSRYVCVDPEESARVFDYLNGINGSKSGKEKALVHLNLCLRCKDAAAALILLHKTVRGGILRKVAAAAKTKPARKAQPARM